MLLQSKKHFADTQRGYMIQWREHNGSHSRAMQNALTMMLTCLNRSSCKKPLQACSWDDWSLVQTLLKGSNASAAGYVVLSC